MNQSTGKSLASFSSSLSYSSFYISLGVEKGSPKKVRPAPQWQNIVQGNFQDKQLHTVDHLFRSDQAD